MLTTALTMAIPCKSKADAVVVDSQETLTSSNSIYQDADGGIAIRTGADLDFSGGGIMDYSSYHSASGKTGTINIPLFSGSKSQTIESLLVGGDFTVDGGNLSGAIKLYKGHDITSVTICAETGTCSDYPVSSAGNFIISGGDFRFTQSGEILMKATAIGEFYLNNGNFYLTAEEGDCCTITPVTAGVTISNPCATPCCDQSILVSVVENIDALNTRASRLSSYLTAVTNNLNTLQNELSILKINLNQQ